MLRRGGATRATYASVISFFRFFEEAGEVAEKNRLHSHPAVANFRREAALAAETLLPAAATDQAPALPLRLLDGLKATVSKPACPRHHRGYAWLTLLRH